MSRYQFSSEEKARGARLANTLREARLNAGKSQEAVARGADLSVETIRRIERQLVPNPGFFTVLAVAEVLHVSIARLRVNWRDAK